MEWKRMNEMCDWELDEAIYIAKCARDLGMDLTGYGDIDVNPNSGNVYIWLEDYPFSIYMPIDCELCKDNVWVLWNNSEDGTEPERKLSDFVTLEEIEDWCTALENGGVKI